MPRHELIGPHLLGFSTCISLSDKPSAYWLTGWLTSTRPPKTNRKFASSCTPNLPVSPASPKRFRRHPLSESHCVKECDLSFSPVARHTLHNPFIHRLRPPLSPVVRVSFSAKIKHPNQKPDRAEPHRCRNTTSLSLPRGRS